MHDRRIAAVIPARNEEKFIGYKGPVLRQVFYWNVIIDHVTAYRVGIGKCLWDGSHENSRGKYRVSSIFPADKRNYIWRMKCLSTINFTTMAVLFLVIAFKGKG